ncbi:uncharacterized protein FFUJ_00223 [Fusarium fujikuroi IMI 58289]|uniref:Uncharacterized protein n=1 Tax=Gibberella fujikuroi (strain CBS 195.34 / IMI 58289 / NRRL A-6831) TaxID=1279085 RepID=S0DL79_GIBF5|nr:uncharacterized protein FFUJ_00223 [Fusarium fujikuroi IMI 58289]SCN66109.1 uncharacterized protein FFE2_00270 [Fusarium fujikuroi]CCT63155.1 uncharacterized protein FFUJ_00223 [Fusarium fujikuroi IMI 58289]SCN71708.1 uncharacterized protein FFM5_00233 [Fusarium fujikuroi]SCO28324.1 uncharacterized protein FFNC_00268 [Fusarium fujikuroi]SCV26426.1 uncharacterized protein FFFS_00268 [Fusarium fujikuroi]
MNRRLERLYELGVLRARLQADEEGLPTFVAMPNKPLKLLAPANYYRVSGENDFATKASTAVNSTRLQILGDLKAMDEFLAKSTTSATAEKLADGESLTRYPQAMARIIRYDGDDVAHDVKEHDENSFVIINAFSEEMAQARDEDPRAYAWGNVARAAEHMRKFLEWQLNADLLVSMNQAMNGLDLPSDDEEVRSEQEVD